MIIKETLSPGNSVLVGVQTGKILELLSDKTIVAFEDGTVESVDYEKLDGKLITEQHLSSTYYEPRTVNLSGNLIQDWIKNVIVSTDVMYTVSLKKLENGCWLMKIEDKDYNVISTATVYFVHNLENIISTVIFSHKEHH